MSLRDRKKADTRARVMTVALRLFGERGFDHTTVEEIAAAADVAPRTFFRYFPTKVDVLFADHETLLEALRDTLAARRPGESVVRAVRRWAQEGLDHLLVDPARYLTRSGTRRGDPGGARAQPPARQRVRGGDRARAGRRRRAETDLAARLTARAAWAATRAARDVWLASGGERDPRQLVDEAFDLVERGLASAQRPGTRSGSRTSSTPRRTASARSPGPGSRRRPRAPSR